MRGFSGDESCVMGVHHVPCGVGGLLRAGVLRPFVDYAHCAKGVVDDGAMCPIAAEFLGEVVDERYSFWSGWLLKDEHEAVGDDGLFRIREIIFDVFFDAGIEGFDFCRGWILPL